MHVATKNNVDDGCDSTSASKFHLELNATNSIDHDFDRHESIIEQSNYFFETKQTNKFSTLSAAYQRYGLSSCSQAIRRFVHRIWRKPKFGCCGCCCCCCSSRRFVIAIASFFSILFVSIFVALPLAFRFSPEFQRLAVFVYYVNRAVAPPQSVSLNCTESLMLESDDRQILLGTWYTEPIANETNRCLMKNGDDRFTNASLVVLYAHGAGSTRSVPFRATINRILSRTPLNAHVVSFDYRGFGDSTATALPSVNGVVADLRAIYAWIRSYHIAPDRILIWGHSLGTAIVTSMVAQLPPDETPMAIVLEGSFTSIAEEVEHFPPARIFRWLPYFDYCIRQPLATNAEVNFDSLAQIARIGCPILFLHSADDHVVPYALGLRLYEAARAAQPLDVANRTRLHRFAREKHHRHNHISSDPDLPMIVSHFIRSIK